MQGLTTGIGGLAVAGALAGATAYALLNPRTQMWGPVLVAPRRPDEVALTFDDGPNPEATPALLAVLGNAGVRATFFLIGQFVRREPGLVREIVAAGHLVGGHTVTHPRLPLVSAARKRVELRDCQRAIEDTTGLAVRFFRAPYGSRGPGVVRIAQELGMTTVAWNVIVGDWKGGPADAIAARVERGIAARAKAGWAANVVLHDGGHLGPSEPRGATVEAVRRVLAAGREREFVTLDRWIAGKIAPR